MEVLEWLSDPPVWLTAPFGALTSNLAAISAAIGLTAVGALFWLREQEPARS